MNLLQKYNDNHFWERMEFYRFSIMMFTITFGTAFASVALYYIYELQNEASFIPIAIITFFAMGSNAAAIAQSPLKWVITMFASNVIISIFFIFYAFII